MTPEFNKWWDTDVDGVDNPYRPDSACYWAWEGWQASARAEREKVAKWMIERSYATGHGDTIEDLLKELEWQIAENWTNALVKGVQTEREACALICENMERNGAWITKAEVAAAIRAGGEE